jgi:hypothetical protein
MFAVSANSQAAMHEEGFRKEQPEVTITVSQSPDFVKKSAV